MHCVTIIIIRGAINYGNRVATSLNYPSGLHIEIVCEFFSGGDLEAGLGSWVLGKLMKHFASNFGGEEFIKPVS